MALHQVSEDYLRSISPLARWISEDIVATKEAYQELWDTLDSNERNQVLDEALVDPAIVLKYAQTVKTEGKWRMGPLCQFSWFTKSQLNLCSPQVKAKTPVKRPIEALSPARNPIQQNVDTSVERSKECPPPREPPAPQPSNLLGKLKNKVLKGNSSQSTGEEKQGLVEGRPSSNYCVVPKAVLAKPKTPPPPPPTALVPNERKALLSQDDSENGDDIPKTGFDFLDNW